MYGSEISNEYSKRWVESNHTHNFWYLYAFISWNLYSYSKLEVVMIFILNNTYEVVDFDSPWLNIYTIHKISSIRVRTLKYSLNGFVLLCWLLESLESFISSIFLKFWIYMSRLAYESNIFRMVWVWCQRCTHTHCNLYL